MGFNELWAEADPDAVGSETSNEPPPAGEYTAGLMDARAIVAKNSGKEFLILSFQTPDRGHSWDVLFGFGSQAAANVAKQQVRELGVDVSAEFSSLDEVAEACKAFVGGWYAVEVVENGEYRNTYVRGKAGGSDIPVPQEAVAQPAQTAARDEDIPF